MANGLGGLGGLGGLFKGLSGILPQDDPQVKLMNAQTAVEDGQKKIDELYMQMGRQAVEKYGLAEFGVMGDKLKLAEIELDEAKKALASLKNEQEQKEKAQAEERQGRICPECGYENVEGVKFCSECGARLGGVQKAFCTSCGAENAPGTKFCGECGARL